MKVYKVELDLNGFEAFKLRKEDKEFLREFKKEMSSGERMKGKFDNLEIEIADVGKISDLPKFWSYIGTLVFSQRAKNILEEYLRECVEFVPLNCNDIKYYILNIIKVIDAIDYDSATFRKLDTGLIVGIDNYSFIPSKIKDINMFKVLLNGKAYNSEVYVSSELKEKIEEFNLVGFDFTEIWNL